MKSDHDQCLLNHWASFQAFYTELLEEYYISSQQTGSTDATLSCLNIMSPGSNLIKNLKCPWKNEEQNQAPVCHLHRQKHLLWIWWFQVFFAALQTGKGLNPLKPWFSEGVGRAQPFLECSPGSRDIRLVWNLSSLSARSAQLQLPAPLESSFLF